MLQWDEPQKCKSQEWFHKDPTKNTVKILISNRLKDFQAPRSHIHWPHMDSKTLGQTSCWEVLSQAPGGHKQHLEAQLALWALRR
jgi:hypothetical protein